ncbi:sideroflexin-4 isoform X1 [Hypomesus transpacificus]|uniref:sideroflexin-4 isoform X1 n=1 Tax=Hypomesus transpacificus TaxID=137520 RepID=UPI001F07E38D|nr:sideroflexin-4 isoform X1 [Hypomesus transpacificus]
MDPNLQYWKSQGKSFFSRLRLWFDLLDPSYLLSSDDEIKKARVLIASGGKLPNDNTIVNAWKLSLSSVHADTGAVLPVVFRPQALFPISAPLIVASFLPHSGVKPALFWQFMLQSYNAGFNFANRNSSAEQGKNTAMKQVLLLVGSVAYSTCAGAIPQIVVQRLGVINPPAQVFFRSVLPVPLSVALAYFNVHVVRSEESENGILVFDSNGNAVGTSKEAGAKAVQDTALSRAILLGTTAAVPNLLVFFSKTAKLLTSRPLLVAPIRHISTALVLGLMIPVSFSLFPQLGTIKREKLEKELQAATIDGQLFYHRGL